MSANNLSFSSLLQLPDVAQRILQVAGERKVFAFYAEMGAGKTTLIKELCRQLGCHDNFSSPTYSIVNEYRITETGAPVYHMDLYRLKNTNELLDAGIGEYTRGDAYCFIEWPAMAEALLPEDCVKIHISVNDNIRNVAIFMG